MLSLLIAGAVGASQPVIAAMPAPIVGLCRFEIAALSFSGTPDEQARCLMRRVGKRGAIGAPLDRLPRGLASTVNGRARLPDKAAVAAVLAREGIDIGGLDEPVSRAHDGNPTAPLARYFVIHDTSTPYYGDEAFPRDVDKDPRVNDFAAYFPVGGDPEKYPVAHIFLNRLGVVKYGSAAVTPMARDQA